MAARLRAVERHPDTPEVDVVRGWVESAEERSVINVLVTPEIAELLLSYNNPGETNRKITLAGVNLAAQALRGGTWENTGEPVIMSDERLLNDGQHRLRAIAETCIPARMDLRFGVRRHAFASTNSGGKRTAAHALALHRAPNATNVAAVARLVICYDRGLPHSARQRVANRDIVTAYEQWPDLGGFVAYVHALPKYVRSSAVDTLAFFAIRTANEAAIRPFFDVLGSGEGRRDNPAHQLREALLAVKGSKDTGTRVHALALGIIAWNAWRSPPHTLKSLSWKLRDPFPKVDGLWLS